MSRHTSLFTFRESVPIQLSPPRSPSFHPHSFVSEIRSVLGGCSRFRRCCYLISVLSSHCFCGSWAPGVSRSHLHSAVELSCTDRNSLGHGAHRFLAFFPPRSASFSPHLRRSLSSPKGPRM